MTLMDLFIVSAVFGGIGIMILSKLRAQNHPVYRWLKGLMDKSKQKKEEVVDLTQNRSVQHKWF